MKSTEFITEAATPVKSVGIPDSLISMVFSDANLEHDVKPVSVNSKKQIMDLLRNNVVFSVGANGDVGAVRTKQSTIDRNPGATLYLVTADGKRSETYKTTSAAIAGLPRGKYYAAEFGNGGYYHARSYRNFDIGRDNRASSNAKDIAYINDTFGPRLRKEAEEALQHIKNIYFDANPRYAPEIKSYAEDLTKFINKGITKDNIESWLIKNDNYSSGWGSHYTNIDNLFKMFQEEPNTRARFAKHLLEWIRDVKKQATRYANF